MLWSLIKMFSLLFQTYYYIILLSYHYKIIHLVIIWQLFLYVNTLVDCGERIIEVWTCLANFFLKYNKWIENVNIIVFVALVLLERSWIFPLSTSKSALNLISTNVAHFQVQVQVHWSSSSFGFLEQEALPKKSGLSNCHVKPVISSYMVTFALCYLCPGVSKLIYQLLVWNFRRYVFCWCNYA